MERQQLIWAKLALLRLASHRLDRWKGKRIDEHSGAKLDETSAESGEGR